ncbi:PIN domain-containing protein [Candidatus Bathyarchaeota archaeon]|nr:PIN domain-containing protein [Candidatus Bathyarchaeota archaeon]
MQPRPERRKPRKGSRILREGKGAGSGRGFPLRHKRAHKPSKKWQKPSQGLCNNPKHYQFPKALDFKDLSVIYPNVEDYDEALKISASLLRKGKPIPAIDISMAAMCLRRDLTLATGDERFRRVRSVRKEFKIELVNTST